MELTETRKAELARLKAYFPYRIIYATIDKETGAFSASAALNMRMPNKLVREGHEVVIVK